MGLSSSAAESCAQTRFEEMEATIPPSRLLAHLLKDSVLTHYCGTLHWENATMSSTLAAFGR
jgi:hypothetical protein